jgi:hypothetical protein
VNQYVRKSNRVYCTRLKLFEGNKSHETHIEEKQIMERRDFLESAGKCCVGATLCSAFGAAALSQTKPQPQTQPQAKPDTNLPVHSCEERVEFSEGWARRFFDVLDKTVDEKTRKALMEANGQSCATEYLASLPKREERKPRKWDEWIKKVKDSEDGSLVVKDGYVIHSYMWNYQGKPAPEGYCLCPFVESKVKGLSATYCHCSVGYIKEMWGRGFEEPIKVELLESVLRGGKRCRFKIEKA